MNEKEKQAIAESASMIVGGYAFSQTEDNFIRIVNLHAPFHALVIAQDGEVLETNMDDIEINIVLKYWNRNKKVMEEVYA